MEKALAEIERRAAQANKTQEGPDYAAILAAVAQEYGEDPDDLKVAWFDEFLAGPC